MEPTNWIWSLVPQPCQGRNLFNSGYKIQLVDLLNVVVIYIHERGIANVCSEVINLTKIFTSFLLDSRLGKVKIQHNSQNQTIWVIGSVLNRHTAEQISELYALTKARQRDQYPKDLELRSPIVLCVCHVVVKDRKMRRSVKNSHNLGDMCGSRNPHSTVIWQLLPWGFEDQQLMDTIVRCVWQTKGHGSNIPDLVEF